MIRKRELFVSLPTLETNRLLLRAMTMNDADDMYRYASDAEVTNFTTWEPHQSVDVTRAFLADVVAGYADGEVRNWAIVHKDDGLMIGTAGFLFWDEVARRAEIGYALSRDYWGRGLMTEAVAEILRFGFDVMNLNRVEARCDSLNIGSARVMEKCGMQHEGTLRQQFVSSGELRDMLLYAILRSEWTRVQV
jgi:[ribosomal protein S5]-alanine N-acetyltransferase